MERVITLSKDTEHKTLGAVLQFAILRQDRGKLDEEFFYEKLSWIESEGRYYCPLDDCSEYVMHHGRVRYNNNLISVTRKPRYTAAFWSPEEGLDAFIFPSRARRGSGCAPGDSHAGRGPTGLITACDVIRPVDYTSSTRAVSPTLPARNC